MKKNLVIITTIGIACVLFSCSSPDKKAVKGDSIVNVGSGMDPGRDTGYTPRKGESAEERSKKKEIRGYTYEAHVTTEDANFMDAAALGGMMEIDLAKTALHSSNAEIKAFAMRMITDHSRMAKELEQLAYNSGILIPEAYSSDLKEQLELMKNMPGADFDKHYMQMMVRDHSKTITLFETGSQSLSDEVKEFALKYLPVLDAHYKAAKRINSSLK